MRRLTLALAIAALSVTGFASATAAEAPPFPGVYGCFGTYFAFGGQFGLVDAKTYSTFDGDRGHYTYDPKTEILTMTDGPKKGFRYRRVDKTGWTLTPITDKDARTSQNCPYNPAKDPTKPHW